jgi:hypothetical protein
MQYNSLIGRCSPGRPRERWNDSNAGNNRLVKGGGGGEGGKKKKKQKIRA